MRFCAQQENGGVIENCDEWGDRKWAQLMGVTKSEILHKCALWSLESGALKVWHYPEEQENKCISNRINGNKGGRPKKENQPQKEPKNNHMVTETITQTEPYAPKIDNVKERKGKECKGTIIPLPLSGNPEFLKSWNEWQKVRKSKGKVKDWDTLFAKQIEWLKDYSPEIATGILNQSMRNGWQGLFDLKWKPVNNINSKLSTGQNYQQEGEPNWKHQ